VPFFFIFNGRFISDPRSALTRNALVYGDPMQPGGNLRFSAEATQISESRKERILCCVTRVFFAAKHAVREREDPSLPAVYYLAESLSISR
jgi:hypothetical protein